MPRRPRLAAGDLAYHVLNRRVGRLPLFDTPADYAAFEKILAEAQDRTRMRLTTYCLMPNHLGRNKVSGTIAEIGGERLSLQPDGTYRATRTPMLAGMMARVNQDGSSTLRDKNGTVRTFGADGWIRSITDRNGNTVTIVRSGNQIQQIIEPGGRALTFQYGGGGISQITDPLGRTVTYTYEPEPTKWGNPRLKTVTNPGGGGGSKKGVRNHFHKRGR